MTKCPYSVGLYAERSVHVSGDAYTTCWYRYHVLVVMVRLFYVDASPLYSFVVSRCHAWPCMPAYVINLLWNPVLLRGFGGVCGRCTSPKAGLRVIQPRFTLHRLCKHEGAAEKCSVFAQLKRPFCAANESALATVLLVLQVLARGISVRPGRPADPGSFAFSPRDNSELVHLPPRRLQFS